MELQKHPHSIPIDSLPQLRPSDHGSLISPASLLLSPGSASIPPNTPLPVPPRVSVSAPSLFKTHNVPQPSLSSSGLAAFNVKMPSCLDYTSDSFSFDCPRSASTASPEVRSILSERLQSLQDKITLNKDTVSINLSPPDFKLKWSEPVNHFDRFNFDPLLLNVSSSSSSDFVLEKRPPHVPKAQHRLRMTTKQSKIDPLKVFEGFTVDMDSTSLPDCSLSLDPLPSSLFKTKSTEGMTPYDLSGEKWSDLELPRPTKEDSEKFLD
ncbi:hypothetical protein RCL1_005866 [Eukaryota sp. TZLM3-RCL]